MTTNTPAPLTPADVLAIGLTALFWVLAVLVMVGVAIVVGAFVAIGAVVLGILRLVFR